ncbi:hypothetical protein RSAG8_13103, partial [Rhizoctonia solani AG-8 WAC10335]
MVLPSVTLHTLGHTNRNKSQRTRTLIDRPYKNSGRSSDPYISPAAVTKSPRSPSLNSILRLQ